jgi:ArsR family transcriptional regulator, arsenate/arsenite/antimonite-responsive transcriptional repressor
MKKLVETAQAIFDLSRLQVIKLLQIREMCVCELAEILNLSSPRISQHLAVLRRAGIVKERREGKWIFYSLIPETLEEFDRSWGKLMTQPIEALPEMKTTYERFNKADLNQVRQQCVAYVRVGKESKI